MSKIPYQLKKGKYLSECKNTFIPEAVDDNTIVVEGNVCFTTKMKFNTKYERRNRNMSVSGLDRMLICKV